MAVIGLEVGCELGVVMEGDAFIWAAGVMGAEVEG